MLNYLLIETSGSQSFLILCYKNKRERALLGSRNQANDLHESLQGLLHKRQATLADLDFVAVGTGPGSFTGSRVGVLVAKTLSYTLSLPLVPFCSLLALHPEELEQGKPCWLISDAKSKGFSVLDVREPHTFFLKGAEELEDAGALLCFDSQIDLAKKGLRLDKLQDYRQLSPNYDFVCDFVEKAFLSGKTKMHDQVHVSYAFTP